MQVSRKWMEQLRELDTKEITSIEDGTKSIAQHSDLKQEMSDAYVVASEEGKNLLSALQKPCNDERSAKARSRISDYSEAISHVMEVILEIHEQNRQLTILWEKQRVRLSQKFKLYQFQSESFEVSLNKCGFHDIIYFLLHCILYVTLHHTTLH